MADGPRRSFRGVEISRGIWGLALLTRPEQVLRHVHRVQVDRPSIVVARILGARHLVQAVLSGVRPSPEVLAMGVWVDAAHAASAVGLAVVDRDRASAGLIDTVAATGWASAGLHDLRHAAATPPSHDRRRDALARAVLHRAPGGGRLLAQVAAARDAPA
jgi:hypothetical protein